MKSLYQLHISVLRNVAHHCSVDIARDIKHVSSRYENHGDSYLTISLPRLAKALEKGLETGTWPAHEVNSTWIHHKGLPAFLRGFLSRIFDPSTGMILDTPDTQCIWAVRQFCYLTNKIERPCTPEREQVAIDQFVSTDRELIGLPGRIDPDRLRTFIRIGHRLFGRIFQECDRKIASYELIPRHGPGSVAERLTQLERRDYPYWTERLEDVFPHWRYTSNVPRNIACDPVPITEELPVRVVSVPKTQSTPRIIAIEPSAMQYAQQGLKRELYEMIGRGPLSKVLGFQDQTRNRELARIASITRDFSTLDLSEASDRVHWFLLKALLERYPHLWDFVWSTRSHRADVSGHGVIPLQKYASMGSALTFPFEAIVFTILSVAGMEQTASRKYIARDLPGRISVYGDDIIVPRDTTDHVIDWLEHFGAKVNRSKSFVEGNFRESCGAEYYNGTDVSVVRARRELPNSRDDVAETAALVDLRNRAYTAGLWLFVQSLDESLDELIRLPVASASSEESDAFLHRASFLPISVSEERYNRDLQRWEKKVPVLVSHGVSYTLDDESGLLEWFHDALPARGVVNL